MKPGAGRPRVYFERACSKRAERERQKNRAWVPAVDAPLHVPLPPVAEQIEQAVFELAILAGTFYRLSVETANPRLALASERVYPALKVALDENFPGWDQ